MKVAYRTTLQDVEFLINIEYDHCTSVLRFTGATVNTSPSVNVAPFSIYGKSRINVALNDYSRWFLEQRHNLQSEILSGAVRVLPHDEIRPEVCEKCAYWGIPADAKHPQRVCRFWDIPERPCTTFAHEYCSKGFAPLEDNSIEIVDVSTAPSAIKECATPKRYITTSSLISALGTDYARFKENWDKAKVMQMFVESTLNNVEALKNSLDSVDKE